ncbi:MAG: DUF4907 domain-containing protein [Chitinophagaceae bacterium]|nr:DUF4907 domain-containing protein [Chitinophagaceae bacterium]
MQPQILLKLVVVIFLQHLTTNLLFAQTPASPTQPNNSVANFPEASAYTNSNLTYIIIDAPNSTFCYDIYAEGKLMIHQTSAPGLPGNEGFKAREDAEKVAQLVIEKIRKGEMPPTISIDEMPVRK